jgi:hypothetical protein
MTIGKSVNSLPNAEARKEAVRRRKLLRFPETAEPAWREQDHPEFQGKDSSEWVSKLRQQSDRQLTAVSRRQKTSRRPPPE